MRQRGSRHQLHRGNFDVSFNLAVARGLMLAAMSISITALINAAHEGLDFG